MSSVAYSNEYDNNTTRLVCLDRFSEKCVDCYYNRNICVGCYNNRRQMKYFMNFVEFKLNSIKRIKKLTFDTMYRR